MEGKNLNLNYSLTNSKSLINSETSSHTCKDVEELKKFKLTKSPKSKGSFGKYKSNATE